MTSTYKGVRAERNQWRADIQINGKKKFLGYYKSEIAAAQAYDAYVISMGLSRPLNQVSAPVSAFKTHVLPPDTYLVQAKHARHPVSLKRAVQLAISDLKGSPFTAHDVTKHIRQSITTGAYFLIGRPFEVIEDPVGSFWSQKIEHDMDIKNEVTAEARVQGLVPRNTGKYIEFS